MRAIFKMSREKFLPWNIMMGFLQQFQERSLIVMFSILWTKTAPSHVKGNTLEQQRLKSTLSVKIMTLSLMCSCWKTLWLEQSMWMEIYLFALKNHELVEGFHSIPYHLMTWLGGGNANFGIPMFHQYWLLQKHARIEVN